LAQACKLVSFVYCSNCVQFLSNCCAVLFICENCMTDNTKLHKTGFLFFLVLFEFAVYVANDMILPAVAVVFSDINTNSELIPLCMGLFLGGAASIQLFCGPLSDHLGRRRTIIVGGIIILLGNGIGIFSFDVISFSIARVLQGMGLCFIVVAGYACLHEFFNQTDAVRNIAWISSTAVVAPLLGPTLGSLILIAAGWRYIFVFTFSVALIAVIGLYFTMPETLPKEKRVLFRFSSLFPSYMDLLRNKTFLSLCLLSATTQLTMVGWIGCSPVLAFRYLDLDPITFGLIQIPFFLSIIAGKLILRKLIIYHDLRKLLFFGFSIAILGGMIIFLSGVFSPKSILMYTLLSGMVVFCFGYGIFNITVTRLILESTEKLKGIASGFNSFTLLILSTVALIIASFVPLYQPAIFSIFLVSPLVIAVCLMVFVVKSGVISHG
jgi:MFS family permease